jgi:co-chaperonin GroES (HSP10)
MRKFTVSFHAPWASQPQKSVTLQPQPGEENHKVRAGHVVALGERKKKEKKEKKPV